MPQTSPTPQQKKAAVEILMAVTETIRELGEIPSGTLYSMLMNKISFADYEAIVAILVGSTLVRNENNLLRWVGPKIS